MAATIIPKRILQSHPIYQIAMVSTIKLSLASAVERQMFEEYVKRKAVWSAAAESAASFRLEPQATRAKLIRKLIWPTRELRLDFFGSFLIKQKRTNNNF